MESFRASLSLLVDRIETWGSEKDFLSHSLELDVDELRLCGSSGSSEIENHLDGARRPG